MKALRHLFVAAAVASVPAMASTVAVRALRATDNLPVAEARVTLFTPDLLFFREVRTDSNGMCAFSLVGEGEYQRCPAGSYNAIYSYCCMAALVQPLDLLVRGGFREP